MHFLFLLYDNCEYLLLEENGKSAIRGKRRCICPCFCGSWELAIIPLEDLLVGKQQSGSKKEICCIFVWDDSQQSWFN